MKKALLADGKIDRYSRKFIAAIEEAIKYADRDKRLAEIIDKIYNDGFEDCFNEL